jgi:hypothetical protein
VCKPQIKCPAGTLLNATATTFGECSPCADEEYQNATDHQETACLQQPLASSLECNGTQTVGPVTATTKRSCVASSGNAFILYTVVSGGLIVLVLAAVLISCRRKGTAPSAHRRGKRPRGGNAQMNPTFDSTIATLQLEPWYHGAINREEAEVRLRQLVAYFVLTSSRLFPPCFVSG